MVVIQRAIKYYREEGLLLFFRSGDFVVGFSCRVGYVVHSAASSASVAQPRSKQSVCGVIIRCVSESIAESCR